MKKEITTKSGTKINVIVKGYGIDLKLISKAAGEVAIEEATFDRKDPSLLGGWGTVAGKRQFVKIQLSTASANELRADQATIKAADKAEFERLIPGYKTLTSLISEEAAEWGKNRKSFEEGIINYTAKTTPADVAAAKSQYPIAAAYIHAENFELASHFEKSGAGTRAKKRLLEGENHKTVIDEMEKEWSQAATRSVLNS